MYLFTLLDFINDVDSNKTCYDTSAKKDGTNVKIRKTEKNEGKDYLNEKYFF